MDFQSIKDDTFTLRDRDTTKQVRADLETICSAVKSLAEGAKVWKDVAAELPEFLKQETE